MSDHLIYVILYVQYKGNINNGTSAFFPKLTTVNS